MYIWESRSNPALLLYRNKTALHTNIHPAQNLPEFNRRVALLILYP